MGSGTVLLDGLRCDGSEGNLFECPYTGSIGVTSCSHTMDAGVRCQRRACN